MTAIAILGFTFLTAALWWRGKKWWESLHRRNCVYCRDLTPDERRRVGLHCPNCV